MSYNDRTVKEGKYRILILGASGFIGNALYKELCSYFDTYGTYYSSRRSFGDNHQFIRYDLQEDDIFEVLEKVRPNLIISALRGDFGSLIQVHQHLSEYIQRHNSKIFFLSSANVFDTYSKYPSYELDKTLSESIYGRLKIKIENMLLRLPQEKMGILRIPMVFGNNSPRIKELRSALDNKEPIEVFPNLIINITNDDRLSQQIHYLINRNKSGIYHLGSVDLVHHEDLIQELVKKIGLYNPVYKRVFTTNDDRYLAVLPKTNKLPKDLQIKYQEIIDHHIFS